MSESYTAELPFPSAEPQPPSELGERWLPVVGWPNYMVSDLGRVWSRPRLKTAGGIMKHNVDRRTGRHGLNLHGSGRHKFRRVHQLVAEAFIGPCPAGQEVRHLNDDHDDNRLVNLEYGPHARNMEEMSLNGKSWHGNKTHCKHGHEYTPENTEIGKSGSRFCLACRAARVLRDKLARQAARISVT